jgi:hypothetical protein
MLKKHNNTNLRRLMVPFRPGETGKFQKELTLRNRRPRDVLERLENFRKS